MSDINKDYDNASNNEKENKKLPTSHSKESQKITDDDNASEQTISKVKISSISDNIEDQKKDKKKIRKEKDTEIMQVMTMFRIISSD